MKNILTVAVSILILALFTVTFSGCQIVGDIFGAGVYTGIFLVIIVIVAIIFVFAKISKKN